MIPLIKKKFTQQLQWLSEEEMLELVAIGQSSPGAIAVNSATLIGYRVAGLSGALLALLGTVLPPLVIVTCVYLLYDFIRDNSYVSAAMRGMQAGIAAVIADVVYDMCRTIIKAEHRSSILVMLLAFAAAWFFKVNVIIIIAACGALGAITAVVQKRRKSGAE